MNSYTEFASIHLVVAAGWEDITGSLDAGSPATLAKSDGVGALQFTVAIHTSGPRPNLTGRELVDMLATFAAAHRLPPAKNVRTEHEETWIVSGEFEVGDEVIRAWYVTDGSRLAFATYVSQEPRNDHTGEELSAADAMVRSIRF